MKKLELKHIVGYLPYGLKCRHESNVFMDVTLERQKGDYLSVNSLLEGFGKPILRPLSDLTKEIEHNGERFVPEFIFDDQNSNVNSEIYLTDFESRMYFEDFIKNHRDHHLPFMPYGMIEKLYEWHFDIHGLIDKGLAISIHETN